MKCLIYTRVSTSEQARGQYTSLDAQEDACKSYIAIKKEEGWEWAKTIVDPGFSGKDLERPGIQQVLDEVRYGNVDVVISYKIDRVARSLTSFYEFYETLAQNNVVYISATQSFDTSTPMGVLIMNILLSFAQFERELIVERTKDKLRANAERGRWNGGTVPMGFQLDRVAQVLQAVPEEAAVVREIFDLFLDKQSQAEVRRIINKEGQRTKRRKITTRDGKTRATGGKKFNIDTISRILTNPIYIGKVRYDDDVFDGAHDGIVDERVFNRVQQILAKKNGKIYSPFRDQHVHLLKGLVRCEDCGSTMTPYPSGKKDKDGNRYLYYTCTRVIEEQRDCACRLRSLSARSFENTIIQFLRVLVQDSDTLSKAIQTANSEANKNLGPLQHEKKRLDQARAKLTTRIKNFVQALGNEGLLSAELQQAHAEALAERATLDKELALLEVEISNRRKTVIDMEVIRESLRHLDQVIDKLAPADQKRLIQLLIREIRVWPVNPDEQTRPGERRGLLTQIRTKVFRFEVQLHEIPGLDQNLADVLTKFGSEYYWLPG